MLEPCDGKLSCTVLREEGGSNPSDLLDYSDLAWNLGGDIIYAGGGKSGKFIINPLQVKPVPSDDDNDNSVSPLAQHIKSVEIFFSLYSPQITAVQLLILKQILEDLYSNFAIDWDTDVAKLKNTDYPIFTDLYNLLCNIIDNDKDIEETTYLNDLMFLKLVVRELAHGSDQFLWNGHTTVESNAKFVVIDTYDLKGTSDNIKKAQYYVILTWAWDKMSCNREEQVMLYCDEAYLMVDTRIPQSLIFLDNMSRQARKYWSGLCVITHAVGDFLDPSIRKYGQAILDNATYKFLFGTDGKGLQDISELFNLTLAEQERLSAKKQKHCIGFIGKLRFYFRVMASDNNLRRMGKGGGA